MLGCFKIWNIIKFTNKGRSSEDFNETHKIALDGMSYNMYS